MNEGVGKTVILYPYIDNHFHKFWIINCDFNWFIIYYFSQTINNDKNQVIVIAHLIGRQQQTYDKIH